MLLLKDVLITFIVLVVTFGYYIHKRNPDTLKTWRAGIFYVLSSFIETTYDVVLFLYQKLKSASPVITDIFYSITGQTNPKKIINPAFMLSDCEVLALVKRLDGHPYDTPTLISYIPNSNGVSYYEIGAVGLVEKYKGLTVSELAQLILHVIRNFFMETRNIQVWIYLIVVSPTRLRFAVALSEEGRRILELQLQRSDSACVNTDSGSSVIEEEILEETADSESENRWDAL